MGSRWTWRFMALPGAFWLGIFFLVSFYAVIAVAFGNEDLLSQPVPFWNPLDWNVGYVLETLRNFWHGGPYLTVSLRTIEFVAIAVGLSLELGLLDERGGWLNGQPITVIIALVYGYIPFFILPLFVAIDRIDKRQI